MRALWVALVVVAWLDAGRVEARPTIAIVATRGAPALPSLAAQVELHTGGRATVVLQAEPDADPLTFADQASERVASGRAAIVVWIAPVDAGFLVFVAGQWTGRALTELVRIDAGLGVAEIERTIALKIAGLVDAIEAPAPALGERLRSPPAPPIDEPRRAAPAPRRGVEWRIEVDGAIAYEPHQRGVDGRAAVAIGRAWVRGPWRIAPALGAHWQPSGTIEGAAGRASIVELGGRVAIEGAREVGPLELFARPQLIGAALVARGTADDGRRGQATVISPYVGLGLGLRVALSPTVRVGITAGGELALLHRQLLIDRETIIDLGRFRVDVGATLLVSI